MNSDSRKLNTGHKIEGIITYAGFEIRLAFPTDLEGCMKGELK